MAITLRFRVPSAILKQNAIHATDGSSLDTGGAAKLPAESASQQSTLTIQQPATSHVDYPITVDPHEPLQSAFDKLFQSYLPRCCLSSQQTREQQNTSEAKQPVRFIAVGQVVYLAPTLSADNAKLKSGTVINVLAVNLKEAKGGNDGDSRVTTSSSSSLSTRDQYTPISRPSTVHYVDVNLPWTHSLCQCCLLRILRPSPPATFHLPSLKALKEHLLQPVSPSLPAAGKADPAAAVAAEGMMLEWLAEPRVGLLLDLQELRHQLAESMGINELNAARAAASAARGAAGAAGATAAGATSSSPAPLWWCCWQCSDCWTAYRKAVSIAAFLALTAKLPRLVTLWRAHLLSPSVLLPVLAASCGAGRQGGTDNLASLLLQVVGVKSRQQLQSGFAALMLPLLPGGRQAHAPLGGGQGGGMGENSGSGKGVEMEEWREGVGGVEWDRYVQRMGEILSRGGLQAEQYRCCCGECGECGECVEGEREEGRESQAVSSSSKSSGMVITGIDPTQFALNCALSFTQAPLAECAATIFTESASSRDKERVEDAAVEEARRRLAAPGVVAGSTGRGVVGNRGSTGISRGNAGVSRGSTGVSGGGLVPVNSNAVVAVFTHRVACIMQWLRIHGPTLNPPERCTRSLAKRPALALPHPIRNLPYLLARFGAIPKPVAVAGKDGSAAMQWEEFPEGNRAAVQAQDKKPGEFAGVKTFEVGDFPSGSLDEKELRKESNTMDLRDPSRPFFNTVEDRVEEFLRRFARKQLAKEGRRGPLVRAITDWVGRLGLGEDSWKALALGPLSDSKLKPIVRSREDVDVILKSLASLLSPFPACTCCRACVLSYCGAVTLVAFAASFAFRPPIVLLRCLLSLYPRGSPKFKVLWDAMTLPPLPAAVPDSLVEALVEGVMDVKGPFLLFCVLKMLLVDGAIEKIQPVPASEDGAGKEEGQKQGKGREEWRMWEEVESWRRAALRAWPGVEFERASDWLPLDPSERQQGRVGGAVVEMCDGMRRASRERERGKAGPCYYMAPWPGGVNPLACLREMLLGETRYCRQTNAFSGASAAATSGAGSASAAAAGWGLGLFKRRIGGGAAGASESDGRVAIKVGEVWWGNMNVKWMFRLIAALLLGGIIALVSRRYAWW